jgi:hypothetical protein
VSPLPNSSPRSDSAFADLVGGFHQFSDWRADHAPDDNSAANSNRN